MAAGIFVDSFGGGVGVGKTGQGQQKDAVRKRRESATKMMLGFYHEHIRIPRTSKCPSSSSVPSNLQMPLGSDSFYLKLNS